MNTDKIIILARKHIGKGKMVSSAELCLSDAIDLYDSGNFPHAKQRALKSLAYSVGVFHQDYKKVLASLK